MANYASGKHARAISDRSGMEFPHNEMVREWNGALVHVSEFEPKQPQLEPKPHGADAISLQQVRVARTEPITTVMLPQDPFTTYQAGSGIINVYSPGHGLTNGTTYLFRGAPTTSPGTGTPTNPVFAYGSIPNFDGITGAQITQGSGYAITTGLFKNGLRLSTDYAISNFFFKHSLIALFISSTEFTRITFAPFGGSLVPGPYTKVTFAPAEINSEANNVPVFPEL